LYHRKRGYTGVERHLVELPIEEIKAARSHLVCAWPVARRSETPEQWIELGARVHGAFGAFIPVGIRIGLDAKERLKADARGLSVTYYNGEKPPCPCVADGVMIATQASPGQGTFQMAAEKAPAGVMAMIIIRNRKTGEGLKYNISDEQLPTILGWNKLEPKARFEAAMAADHLFQSDVVP
jgi:formylmethanofuran dehydrogenase subunit E